MIVAGGYITIPGGGGAVTGAKAGTVIGPEFRIGEVRGPDAGAAARQGDHRRRRRLHQADRHRRRAGDRQRAGRARADARGNEGSLRPGARRWANIASPMPTAPTASRQRSAPARAPSSMPRLIDDEGLAAWPASAASGSTWTFTTATGSTRSAPATDWPAEYLQEEPRHDRPAAPGLRQGGEARRAADLRHRRRRLSARAQRPPVPLHGPLRHDADAGAGQRHQRGRQGPGAGRSGLGRRPAMSRTWWPSAAIRWRISPSSSASTASSKAAGWSIAAMPPSAATAGPANDRARRQLDRRSPRPLRRARRRSPTRPRSSPG